MSNPTPLPEYHSRTEHCCDILTHHEPGSCCGAKAAPADSAGFLGDIAVSGQDEIRQPDFDTNLINQTLYDITDNDSSQP